MFLLTFNEIEIFGKGSDILKIIYSIYRFGSMIIIIIDNGNRFFFEDSFDISIHNLSIYIYLDIIIISLIIIKYLNIDHNPIVNVFLLINQFNIIKI